MKIVKYIHSTHIAVFFMSTGCYRFLFSINSVYILYDTTEDDVWERFINYFLLFPNSTDGIGNKLIECQDLLLSKGYFGGFVFSH